jgi:hypothetical protein
MPENMGKTASIDGLPPVRHGLLFAQRVERHTTVIRFSRPAKSNGILNNYRGFPHSGIRPVRWIS